MDLEVRELKQLDAIENKEKYLEILSQRISENKKTENKLMYLVLISGLCFPLLFYSKIPNVSFSIFSSIDVDIVLAFLPTIFSFTYYKMLLVSIEISKQIEAYSFLSGQIFKTPNYSKYFVIGLIKPYEFLDSISKNQLDGAKGFLSYLTMIIYIPSILVVAFLPMSFNIYFIYKLIDFFRFDSFIDIITVIIPFILMLATVLLNIQLMKNSELDKKNDPREKL